MKEIIKKAVDRVRAGKGTSEDKAIMHLLEQCRDLRLQLKINRENGAENNNVPAHQATPWYMQ